MSTDANDSGERVVVGRIGKPHGIHGDVYVQPLTDVPEVRFSDGNVLYAGDPVNGNLQIETTKEHSGRLIAHFVGVETRNGAEELRNALLETDIDPKELPGEDGEFFDRQLQGLVATDPAGTVIGQVNDVVHLPAQDLLAVQLVDGSERLIPFVSAIVPTVDLAAGKVVIDAPPGLLEDDVEDDDESSGPQD
ncbi:MAG TPA: ribosome maturation factor RimM [Actinobacteria bacterium]|jgi:16S rRNA processing protein RimM|nr:ribosome maturation factor RimM [Actinomycetota bacterium]